MPLISEFETIRLRLVTGHEVVIYNMKHDGISIVVLDENRHVVRMNIDVEDVGGKKPFESKKMRSTAVVIVPVKDKATKKKGVS